jgi:hypothetical protein
MTGKRAMPGCASARSSQLPGRSATNGAGTLARVIEQVDVVEIRERRRRA